MSFTTHPNEDEILKVPGYLYHNPSALDTEENWGTLLGYTKAGVEFQPGHNVIPILREETAEAPQDFIFVGARPVVTVVLRNWNATAIERLFPGLSSSKKIRIPGGIKPGTRLGSGTYSKALLFVPQDTTNNPAMLLQKACPMILATAKLLLSHRNETLFPAIFHGLPKTTGANGTCEIDLLENLTLV